MEWFVAAGWAVIVWYIIVLVDDAKNLDKRIRRKIRNRGAGLAPSAGEDQKVGTKSV